MGRIDVADELSHIRCCLSSFCIRAWPKLLVCLSPRRNSRPSLVTSGTKVCVIHPVLTGASPRSPAQTSFLSTASSSPSPRESLGEDIRVRPLLSTFWLTEDPPWLISSSTVWLSGNVSLCFPVLIRREPTMSECSKERCYCHSSYLAP